MNLICYCIYLCADNTKPVASMKKQKIYLSSTARDLKKYREHIRLLIDSTFFKGYDTSVIMEQMSDDGRNEKSVDTCLNQIADSDVYILILARSYGSLVNYNNAELSYTHHEYIKATEVLKAKNNFWLFKMVFDESSPAADAELNSFNEPNTKLYNDFKADVTEGNQCRTFTNLDSFKEKFKEILYEVTQTQLNNLMDGATTKNNYEIVKGQLPFCGRTDIKEIFHNIVGSIYFAKLNFKNIFLQSFEVEHTDYLFQYINHYFQDMKYNVEEKRKIYCNFPSQINAQNMVILAINDDTFSSESRFKASLGMYLSAVKNEAALKKIIIPVVLKYYSNEYELKKIVNYLKGGNLYEEIDKLTNKNHLFEEYYLYITIIYNNLNYESDSVIALRNELVEASRSSNTVDYNGRVKPLFVNEIEIWKTEFADVARVLSKVSIKFNQHQYITMQEFINQLNN